MLPGNCGISVATEFADDNDQSRVAAMLAAEFVISASPGWRL